MTMQISLRMERCDIARAQRRNTTHMDEVEALQAKNGAGHGITSGVPEVIARKIGRPVLVRVEVFESVP